MLCHICIDNLVLIDHLDLDVAPGLTVLSGETGAGKSILLDGLGLATGARADAKQIRPPAAQATASVVFSCQNPEILARARADYDLDFPDDGLVLRRRLQSDGRTRAFCNDQPISVAAMRQIGQSLISFQGQHEQFSLRQNDVLRDIVDQYGGHQDLLVRLQILWQAWQSAKTALEDAQNFVDANKRDYGFLSHAVGELNDFAPLEGEESQLDKDRQRLKHAARIVESLKHTDSLLNGQEGAALALTTGINALERLADVGTEAMRNAQQALDRALIEVDEASGHINDELRELDKDAQSALTQLEDRLFQLRGLARKYDCHGDELDKQLDNLQVRLDAISTSQGQLGDLQTNMEAAARAYKAQAEKLHKARCASAKLLEAAVLGELPALKLPQARFAIAVTKRENDQISVHGMDDVAFLVCMNPPQPMNNLADVASGGELSRLLLALKVCMAQNQLYDSQCLVFDEIDQGLGGAVASAVGQRLMMLAQHQQVIVVTHSPQVAACADNHWLVAKSIASGATDMQIKALDHDARVGEIARMLAGETITDQALAAAAILLNEAKDQDG